MMEEGVDWVEITHTLSINFRKEYFAHLYFQILFLQFTLGCRLFEVSSSNMFDSTAGSGWGKCIRFINLEMIKDNTQVLREVIQQIELWVRHVHVLHPYIYNLFVVVNQPPTELRAEKGQGA